MRLGPIPTDRKTRIMVTRPSEAAIDPSLIRGLLEKGMNIMRINCAHDNAEILGADGRAPAAGGKRPRAVVQGVLRPGRAQNCGPGTSSRRPV